MLNLRKLLPLVIIMMLLLTSCRPNMPYKSWDDFEQMKKDIGDHFLYPTYIPEGLDDLTGKSWYNSTVFKERAKDPYYGYYSWAFTDGKFPQFEILVIDPNLKRTTMGDATQISEYEIIESWTEGLMGIELSISTIYYGRRVTSIDFEINDISYSIFYCSDVEADKDTDPVQLEELLKVASSIIEQTQEDD